MKVKQASQHLCGKYFSQPDQDFMWDRHHQRMELFSASLAGLPR